MYNIGEDGALICFVYDSLAEWTHDGEVVSSGNGTDARLEFPAVNDTLHGEVYICRVYMSFFILRAEYDITIIVNGRP